MKFKTLTIALVGLLISAHAVAKNYIVLSPDGHTTITVNISGNITWQISHKAEVLLNASPMQLDLEDGRKLGNSPVVLKSETNSVNQTITAIVPVRNKYIKDQYNELTLKFKGDYSVKFRAYDNGVAYRFITALKDSVEIKNEDVTFNFKDNCQIFLPKEKDPNFQSHYEADFQNLKLASIAPETYGYLPLYVANDSGTKMVVTESDLHDYPNMFLFGTGGNSLTAHFPKVALELKNTGNIHLDEIIVKKADYQAKTCGTRTYPWRILMISDNDKGLLENDLVYQLASPNVLTETNWIKPGKVAWDWWNDLNIYGVNFKAGINTETYKYYIDFAAAYGLEYVMLDEGWCANPRGVLTPAPGLDLQELIKYAAAKNVGIMLWTLWKPMDEHMEKILTQYEQWGIKGVKVDFMARADQQLVNFYDRLAASTAKHHLLLDLHGAFKPVGLNRKYPNVLNYEGVKGMEQSKWSEIITPAHDATLPFTRMAAGPMDFTPGAMLNSNKGEFIMNWSSPMSQGTRAHQASMYVIYDAPLQMFADNPSNYMREPIYTHFVARFPTTWDKTIGLEGKVGEYVVVARKHGEQWFIGGMTDWTARTFEIPVDFLDNQRYQIEILKDGDNVDRRANDYQIINRQIAKNDTLKVDMASGGGYTAILTPIK